MDAARRAGFTYMDLDDFEDHLADKPEHERWELIGGRVVKLTGGARWTHHRIVQNISAFLADRLAGAASPASTYAETFWLKERSLRLAVFPDIMIQCRRPDPEATSVEDPAILLEVVSPGTAFRDRVEKAALYRRLPALQHYVLVERDQPRVDVLSRAGPSSWSNPVVVTGLDAAVHLAAIDLDLPLSAIYRRVLAD